MSALLSLANIRNVLIRLEETIIFSLIERSQFRENPVIYQPDALGDMLGGRSLMQYMLYESECSHAKVRRYTSPDEHPFFDELPAPILHALSFSDNPLSPNNINVNEEIMNTYMGELIPLICLEGDDNQYGSAALADVSLLQALSKRIHYGKFVAECKYRDNPDVFQVAIQEDDCAQLDELITNKEVENRVLERVAEKTRKFTAELDVLPDAHTIKPETAIKIYEDWVIPLNKEIQVDYLLLKKVP